MLKQIWSFAVILCLNLWFIYLLLLRRKKFKRIFWKYALLIIDDERIFSFIQNRVYSMLRNYWKRFLLKMPPNTYETGPENFIELENRLWEVFREKEAMGQTWTVGQTWEEYKEAINKEANKKREKE